MNEKLKVWFLLTVVLLAGIYTLTALPLYAEPVPQSQAQTPAQPQLQPQAPVPLPLPQAQSVTPAPQPQPQAQAGVPQSKSQVQAQPAVPQTQPQPQSQATTPQPQPQAQPLQPAIPVTQPQPQPQFGFAPPPAAAKQPVAKKGEVSFNFDDADVFSVVQTILGDILKVNYVVDPRVKGRVNFRSVAPVAKEDVLPLMEVILRLNGIGIVEDSGLYRIVPISDISREPAPVGIGRSPESVLLTGKALLQVIPVLYMQSSELVRILTPFLSTNALIVDVPRSNHMIVVDTDANVQRLLHLVGVFDSEMTRKASPQVFVYPVQNSKAKDIAALLQQIFLGAKAQPRPSAPKTPTAAAAPQPQVSMGAAGVDALVSDMTRIFPDEVTNSIIILSTPEDYTLIAETIKKIDIVSRQVMIEGLLVRVDLTDNLSFGLSWSLNTDVNITNIKPFKNDVNLSGAVINLPGGSLDNSAGNAFTFVGTDPTGNVRARLTAALKDSRAKILASPHIIVSDNREARIQVGSQVPIATSTTTTPLSSGTSTTTNTSTSTIQYKDIGIILKVKPQVNDSGLVSLEIAQEVSSLGDAVKIAGQDFQAINKTEATTNLVAQDGETIIIGGLIREDTTKSKDGIPLLSKIPLLGSLFSNTTDNSTRTELIILLTPHVVKNQRDALNMTSEYINKLKAATKEGVDESLKNRELKKDADKNAADLRK